MSAETSGRSGGFDYWRLRFRAWRGNRPFWAGLFTLISGGPIAYFPYAHLHIGNLSLAMATTAGAGSLIIGVLLVTLGLTMWYHSIVRVFAGVATILLALVSIPVSNLGGFVVGFVFALVGGALSISWSPARQGEQTPAETADPLPGPSGGAGDSFFPTQGGGQFNVTDTTAQANGGRHSAG